MTGATAGLGLETAKVLARRGAKVVLACRDTDKAERAAAQIPADVQIVRVDLASLASVHGAGEEIRAAHSRLDLLILNAGVMDVPYRRTEDGFELILATNHLGHFALTGLLLDRLLTTAGSRIVTVSSVAHRRGQIRFDDLQSELAYDASDAYAQSKLANLLFSYELDRRLRAAGVDTGSLAAHPGNARTELWRSSSSLERAVISRRLRFLNFWLVQGADVGALPTLRAATDPSARGGDYYGPAGRFQFAGHPVRVQSSDRSHDTDAQRWLWEVSEHLTGMHYELPGPK